MSRTASLTLALVAASSLLYACSSPAEETVEARSDETASVPDSTGSELTTTTSSAEVTSGTSASTGRELAESGVEFVGVPDGFSPHQGVRRMEGPVPGSSNEFQEYRNTATTQSVIISVTRGIPTDLNISDPEGQVFREPSERRIGDRDTYVVDLTEASQQLQIGFVVDETTMVWITGFNMSWDELFNVGDTIEVDL